ncbi:MAG: hypothetical protein CMF96_05220 [Candidatus Marinimicrobia bacterium]|nr:hypothetical protein [Candidatus Neomarinimicrobiota bacterium]|tara:strand:+ start:2889 stop:3236 length:348 start_codon:yes stop_codon:yes gene_type:complete
MKKIIIFFSFFYIVGVNIIYAHNCIDEKKHNSIEQTQGCCQSKDNLLGCCSKNISTTEKQCSKNSSKEEIVACSRSIASDGKMQCDKTKCNQNKPEITLSKNSSDTNIKPWWKIW